MEKKIMPELNNVEYESMLCLYDEAGNIKAVFRNDLKNRAIKLYEIKELGLDDIKHLFSKFDPTGMVEVKKDELPPKK